jgi:hypothetical protein
MLQPWALCLQRGQRPLTIISLAPNGRGIWLALSFGGKERCCGDGRLQAMALQNCLETILTVEHNNTLPYNENAIFIHTLFDALSIIDFEVSQSRSHLDHC